MMPSCPVRGCNRECMTLYDFLSDIRRASSIYSRADLEGRFWARVDFGQKPGDCWIWTGTINNRWGYGAFRVGKWGQFRPHRLSYQLLVGPIPDGLVLDHLCRVITCVNPNHLEAVTQRENVRRGEGPSGINSRKTHCNAGHPLEGDNLHITRSGKRKCRTCDRLLHRKRADLKRSKKIGAERVSAA